MPFGFAVIVLNGFFYTVYIDGESSLYIARRAITHKIISKPFACVILCLLSWHQI